MTTEVRVPTLGESVTEATVATWFKQPGDAVAVDEMLCELETDKVTVEVPSPAAGTMGDLVAAEGDTVGVNALLATIVEGAGAAAAPAAKPAAKAEAVSPPATEKAKGKLLEPKTTTGPNAVSIRRKSGRGRGCRSGRAVSIRTSSQEPSRTTVANRRN